MQNELNISKASSSKKDESASTDSVALKEKEKEVEDLKVKNAEMTEKNKMIPQVRLLRYHHRCRGRSHCFYPGFPDFFPFILTHDLLSFLLFLPPLVVVRFGMKMVHEVLSTLYYLISQARFRWSRVRCMPRAHKRTKNQISFNNP